MVPKKIKNPRILIVTPEVTYLTNGMGNIANHLTAKAGGLADVSSALVSALFQQGADVHVALPDYRTLFSEHLSPILKKEMKTIRGTVPQERIHLAEDRAFFYVNRVYSSYEWENAKISLAFQREVINNIVPRVRPDLIHCNDWMTGLVPAMARQLDIPCLFTIHNIYTVRKSLAQIEDMGIDAAAFWNNLYYRYMPWSYEDTREWNPVDFLCSGVFGAHFVNTVSATFLAEVVEGRHPFVEPPLQQELSNKWHAGCAAGILNAPDPSYNPATDRAMARNFGPEEHADAKRENKVFFQKHLGLVQDPEAPVFFWPSRLDTVQKGSQLLAEILYDIVSKYWDRHLQVVIVANGEFKIHFHNIVRFHQIHHRVLVADFQESLARLAYGVADFVLMPSFFEPCGLPQMIGTLYGALPVAHNTGGLHDTVRQLDVEKGTGNGFLFDVADPRGLFWAMEQALSFHALPLEVKAREVSRIMKESAEGFTHAVTARQYIDLYERMLNRPLVHG
jgi:starch synthase/alpha-amylase